MECLQNRVRESWSADIGLMPQNAAKLCLENTVKYTIRQRSLIWYSHAHTGQLKWGLLVICRDHVNFWNCKKIIKTRWTEQPMPQSVIEQVEAMAEKDKNNSSVQLLDCHKQNCNFFKMMTKGLQAISKKYIKTCQHNLLAWSKALIINTWKLICIWWQNNYSKMQKSLT